MDKVKVLNYAADAIDDLQYFIGFSRERGDEGAAQATHKLVALMRRATKFLLPNCAEIVDTGSLGEAHLDLLHLPYPVTVFEAPWERDDPVTPFLNGAPQTRSSRRIALCWELGEQPGPFPAEEERLRAAFPEGGTFVASIYYLDQLGTWSPAAGMVFVPREFGVDPTMEALPASLLALQTLTEAGRQEEGGYVFRVEHIPIVESLFAEAVTRFDGDRAKALSQILVDTRDELQMMIQACAVLNCANVETIDAAPGRAAIAMRAAKKKAPLFTYKVLQLRPSPRAGSGEGGTHASPRMHLRRGHIRRLSDRTVWVRASLVNRGSPDGAIVKDYQIPSTE